MAAAVLPAGHRDKFRDNHEVDLAYSVAGLGRFRCNAFQQRGTIGMIFRVIPMRVATIEDLLLPKVLKKIASEERGLVLVTGTTGSGKSTTLAALIDEINSTRTAHIMTIEDPIEYLHRDNRSVINQREIGVDTRSFGDALRSALRQDPDVILVGEMRDLETIQTALLAAETGHLVFSTLHTLDATETINRIIAVFPPHQQKQIRIQLASVIKAVVSQRLMPKTDGKGRVPAVEVLISTAFIRDCILDKEKSHLIHARSRKARRSTGCRRSTSRSSASSSPDSSPTRKRCAGRPTWTSSSSRCRASIRPPTWRAIRWRASARPAAARVPRSPASALKATCRL